MEDGIFRLNNDMQPWTYQKKQVKFYQGTRGLGHAGSVQVIVGEKDPETELVTNIRALRHIARHSPTGFEWGYEGSGPADLALAILTDSLGCEPEPGTYQQFKRDIIAKLGANWRISEPTIKAWAAKTLAGLQKTTEGKPEEEGA